MIKTWQVVLATIGIFLAGLITGGAITLRVVRYVAEMRRQAQEQALAAAPVQLRPPLAVRPNGTPGELQFGPQLVRRFVDRLDLSPEQASRINAIVHRTVVDLNRLRRETQLSTAFTIERMQDDIAGQLTAAQRAKFDELLKGQRSRLEEFIEERRHRQKN